MSSPISISAATSKHFTPTPSTTSPKHIESNVHVKLKKHYEKQKAQKYIKQPELYKPILTVKGFKDPPQFV